MGLKLFITVGTTEFDELIKQLDSVVFVDSVKSLGYSEVRVQIGRSKFDCEGLQYLQKNNQYCKEINVDIYRYKDSLLSDMQTADVIIGHAGAGTVLDVLVSCQKPMIIVVNDTLQGNHQNELANALQSMNAASNYAYNNFSVCTVSTVIESLQQLTTSLYGNNRNTHSTFIPVSAIAEFPINDSQRFADYMDDLFE